MVWGEEVVHVTRLGVYANGASEVTADLKKIFQYYFTQGNCEMAGIVAFAEGEAGDGFDVQVDWVWFEKEENR